MTVGTVVELVPRSIGKNVRFDPDEILEEAKGQGFVTVSIIGEMPNGKLWVSSAANAGETLILMERAKRQIVFGEE